MKITNNIAMWMILMSNSQAYWSQKQIEAENDMYFESIDFHYNGINRW